MRNLCRNAAITLLSLLIALATLAGSASASPTVITASIQASFDLTAAAADSTIRVRLKSQYSELTLLSAQYDSREIQIRALHDQNAESLIVVREAIKNIDQASVARLTAAVSSAKERYQPLFDQYSALNKRISCSRAEGQDAEFRTEGPVRGYEAPCTVGPTGDTRQGSPAQGCQGYTHQAGCRCPQDSGRNG